MKVLIVESESKILKHVSEMVSKFRFDYITAENYKNAVRRLYRDNPDIILTELRLNEDHGKQLLQKVRNLDASIPVIFMTNGGTISDAVECIQEGAFGYLEKPLVPHQLKSVLEKAADHRKAAIDDLDFQPTSVDFCYLPGIVGQSPAMLELAQKVRHVSQTNATVFLYGESGTGKELVAKTIHELSKRVTKPFIPLDCSTLPANLMESELFGYEKGAFTGALRQKPGVIELAQHGTLFLDEITEMDPHLQSKLLRFLQERQIRRIGGQESIEVDVRIIAATNDNPRCAILDNKLRRDLYYRLNVVPIRLSPLRERKQDIPLLVKHFIKKYSPTTPYNVNGITVEAMNHLKSSDWPGNIRELQNVIEQVISLISHDIIDSSDLPEELFLNYVELGNVDDIKNFKEFKDRYLKNAGKHYLETLLKNCHGNVSQTARTAGVSRRTIYRLFNEYGVNF